MATTTKATTTRKPATKAITTKTPKVETAPEAVAAPALPAEELAAILAADKNAPTALHENMAAWLAAAGVEADLNTIKLVCALRHTFQKSETNQSDLVNRRNAAEAKLQDKARKAAERAQKAAERAAELAAKAAK